jgi:F-type H+-transporting ATPase subunit delta
MNDRRLTEQTRSLMSHVTDGRGVLEPKMVLAVARALGKSRISNRGQLLRRFRREVARLEARQRAVVMSAVLPDDHHQAEIARAIRAQHPGVVTIDWQVDRSVIGGILARVGDTEYNFSVADKLQQVQEHLG